MQPVTPDERERIVEALRSGMSQNSVARQFGRGSATINRIAAECGMEYSAPKNANAARVDYCQANRLVLLNKLFDKAGQLVDQVEAPHELQQLAMATAVLIDKRRLEDGEATSRSEVNSGDSARDRIASRLDELAQRRAEKGAA